MPRQPAESSEGEDFNFDKNVNDFNDSSSDEEDKWQPVVLGPKAIRTDFERVSCRLMLIIHL